MTLADEIPENATVFWHRRDLRLTDNLGLDLATANAPVVPLFCIEEDLLDIAGSDRRQFLAQALTSLENAYRALGSDLLVRFGNVTKIIPEVVSNVGADQVVWNGDYSRYAIDRDEAVDSALDSMDVRTDTTADLSRHEPGSIRTTKGDHYSIFSYYYKKWAERSSEPSPERVGGEQLVEFESESVDAVLPEEITGQKPPLEGTREAAETRLERFLAGPIFQYADIRDYPAKSGTARLSQDLKFGLLGIREVYEATEEAIDRSENDPERKSVEAFQRQLAWRDFYLQVLAVNPEMGRENISSFENPIEWHTDPAALEAWQQGETGYPIVDAGMRQLLDEGYIHNRVRMIVASFLTKDLALDWRKGYRWFRKYLIDHDTANDAGGWQWAASTGTDAQPYFRVFNPMTQGERYDPEAEYIKTYVDELGDLEPKQIHNWNDLSTDARADLAPDYVDPIVDHSRRREMAIEMFEQARES